MSVQYTGTGISVNFDHLRFRMEVCFCRLRTIQSRIIAFRKLIEGMWIS